MFNTAKMKNYILLVRSCLSMIGYQEISTEASFWRGWDGGRGETKMDVTRKRKGICTVGLKRL